MAPEESCERLWALLPAWAEGTLSAVEASELEAHLAACPGCEARLGTPQSSDAWIGRLAPPPSARLLRRLPSPGPRGWRWAAAAVLLGGSIGFLGFHILSAPVPPGPSALPKEAGALDLAQGVRIVPGTQATYRVLPPLPDGGVALWLGAGTLSCNVPEVPATQLIVGIPEGVLRCAGGSFVVHVEPEEAEVSRKTLSQAGAAALLVAAGTVYWSREGDDAGGIAVKAPASASALPGQAPVLKPLQGAELLQARAELEAARVRIAELEAALARKPDMPGALPPQAPEPEGPDPEAEESSPRQIFSKASVQFSLEEALAWYAGKHGLSPGQVEGLRGILRQELDETTARVQACIAEQQRLHPGMTLTEILALEATQARISSLRVEGRARATPLLQGYIPSDAWKPFERVFCSSGQRLALDGQGKLHLDWDASHRPLTYTAVRSPGVDMAMAREVREQVRHGSYPPLGRILSTGRTLMPGQAQEATEAFRDICDAYSGDAKSPEAAQRGEATLNRLLGHQRAQSLLEALRSDASPP